MSSACDRLWARENPPVLGASATRLRPVIVFFNGLGGSDAPPVSGAATTRAVPVTAFRTLVKRVTSRLRAKPTTKQKGRGLRRSRCPGVSPCVVAGRPPGRRPRPPVLLSLQQPDALLRERDVRAGGGARLRQRPLQRALVAAGERRLQERIGLVLGLHHCVLAVLLDEALLVLNVGLHRIGIVGVAGPGLAGDAGVAGPQIEPLERQVVGLLQLD